MFDTLFGGIFGKKPSTFGGGKRKKVVQMMTQYRGIVWAQLLNMAIAWVSYFAFKPYGAYFVAFTTFTGFFVCVTFFLDMIWDFAEREKRVHTETVTYATVAKQHGYRRNIQSIVDGSSAVTMPKAKAPQHNNERRNERPRHEVRVDESEVARQEQLRINEEHAQRILHGRPVATHDRAALHHAPPLPAE